MSVQNDPSGRRYVQVEVVVPGTPEEVWQAIATGPGVSSWFVPTEIRDDGTFVSHFGPGMDAIATPTAWDPPHRFAAEGELGPGAPKIATEWIVAARAGGVCVVRVVHSLFADSDDWDDQLENIEAGWPDYFRILQLYMTHFRGQPSAGIQLMGVTTDPASAAWDRLASALGFNGVRIGERRSAPSTAPSLAGVFERLGEHGHPHQLMLRLDRPTPGIVHLFALAMGGQVFISIRFYLYGANAAAAVERDRPAWQAWMNGLFPWPNPTATPNEAL